MLPRRLSPTFRIGLAFALAGVSSIVLSQAQPTANRMASGDSSGSFEVSGISVDVFGKDAESARLGGWRVAQRKGWQLLSQRLVGQATALPDSTLDAMVTGIVIEQEQIGPNRYVARLGVTYDRGRAGSILGISSRISRSPPMLLIPVQWSGGTGRAFEGNGAWQQAWSRFRTGNSSIDYVRPGGTGPDALLLNVGQTGRRGRGWWRTVVDQYGATDILIPQVVIRRLYPGGPITGWFRAGHGPDNRTLTSFALRVDNGNALDALLDAGVRRIDQAYQGALTAGGLKTDALLAYVPPPPVEEEALNDNDTLSNESGALASEGASITIQFDTPDAGSVTAIEAAVRGVPGVRSAITTSLALGGTSVMRVGYEGESGGLRAALEARGWQVQEGAGVLRISRRAASQPRLPDPVLTDAPAQG